ncbi:PREDICTED: lipase 1-like [Trachymyrmex septentrionalis]|uniref:lipase 1-like n=1 Tax=Trachymyrmex septentrionalis TaxID=34720 RepID=UPI00084EF426|nr:PREDICTED: lipase 1-like [Trachymyrmex septentrionalis]
MRIDIKLLPLVLLTVVLLEARVHADLSSLWKILFNYLFPKDPGIVRVRRLEEVKKKTVNNVSILDFIGLIERYDYIAEEHYITTEDGYNLVIHRISGTPLHVDQKQRPVVFLKSGIFSSSDTWVLFGPGRDLPFLLADEGYDVWLGNSRGNTYCRSHVKLSPQSKNFWRYSYHEIGTKDLPVVIDYVLNYTNQKTLHYISYSMGSTELFVLLSMRPEYNAKIKLGICLAPVAIWKKTIPFLEYFYKMIPNFKEFCYSNEIYEIGSLSSMSIMMGRALCADNTITQAACIALMFLFGGSDPAQLNTTILPIVLSYYPAGSSVQLIDHYFQNMITKKFQAYDYGYFGNYKQYGQITPIIYDLNKVTVPLAIYYSTNDLIATKTQQQQQQQTTTL